MSATRAWMDEATDRFLTAVDELDDDAWEQETLPGWRRRELVAHVHHNADAIRNLVVWAATGVETPMYASREQRDGDIAASAQLPVVELRALVHRSAEALAADLDALDDEAWQRTVATARGRRVPASEIFWMRTKEVAIHGIDLGTGMRFEDLPDDLLHALVDEVVRFRLGRGEAATLAAWLTGRGVAGSDLGPWI